MTETSTHPFNSPSDESGEDSTGEHTPGDGPTGDNVPGDNVPGDDAPTGDVSENSPENRPESSGSVSEAGAQNGAQNQGTDETPDAMPERESERLRTLELYDVLETPPAEAFDRITNIATRLFDVSVAMINFIDRNDQWCVSARGLQASRVPRESSFCTHTIQREGVMVVEDATDDPRFVDNPFVTGDPHIRFYAGAPLTAPNGYRLGTLCLIDGEPRSEFSEEDRELLEDLAGVVMDELNLRHHAYHLDDTLQAQQESDAQTARILESITDAFFALDDSWNFTYVNTQAEKLLERPREDLVGSNVWEEFEPAVGSTFYDEYHRAVRERETTEFMEYYPPLDRWFEVKAFPFVGGLSVYFDDVTERVKAQQDLRRERNLTEAIIDTSIAAVVTVDAGGEVTFANDRASEILGMPADELVGANYLDAGPIYDLDGERIEDEDWPFVQIMKTGEMVEGRRFVVRGREDEGERDRILSVNGAPLQTPDGEIRQVVFSMVDITDQIERQRELERAKNEAERASRLKSSFLANMSHDVRTPLSSIMSLTELLAREAPEDCQERIRLIERSSNRLLDTIDSVLDLSKIESGSVDVDLRPLNVGDEVLGTIEIFQPQAQEKGITLQTDVQAVDELETGAAPPELDAELDPTMLHRITDNLISNALKFTEPGGTVTVRAYATEAAGAEGEEEAGERVVLEVEDTGIGIEEEFLPDLFEAFARGPEQKGHEGNGLGLAITKRLTELMNGTIEVDSEKGVGTCFIVRFPR